MLNPRAAVVAAVVAVVVAAVVAAAAAVFVVALYICGTQKLNVKMRLIRSLNCKFCFETRLHLFLIVIRTMCMSVPVELIGAMSSGLVPTQLHHKSLYFVLEPNCATLLSPCTIITPT